MLQDDFIWLLRTYEYDQAATKFVIIVIDNRLSLKVLQKAKFRAWRRRNSELKTCASSLLYHLINYPMLQFWTFKLPYWSSTSDDRRFYWKKKKKRLLHWKYDGRRRRNSGTRRRVWRRIKWRRGKRSKWKEHIMKEVRKSSTPSIYTVETALT